MRKGQKQSEESKAKISQSKKGIKKTDAEKAAIGKGMKMHWRLGRKGNYINNGEIELRLLCGDIPEGFEEGRLKRNRYCKDSLTQIENYDLAKADNFQGWAIHHKLETFNRDGSQLETFVSRMDLIKAKLYYNRPASELMFIKNAAHRCLHGGSLIGFFIEPF